MLNEEKSKAAKTEADVLTALSRAELLLSESEVDDIYRQLADEITDQYKDKKPVLVAALAGGLCLAGNLMTYCQFPLQLDLVKVSRYRDRLTGGRLSWDLSPALSFADRHILLLDDVLDKGHTLAALKKTLCTSQVASFHTLVLVQKKLDTPPAARANRIGVVLPNRFLVGEGMDVAGYGRNLRGIWALTPEDEEALAS